MVTDPSNQNRGGTTMGNITLLPEDASRRERYLSHQLPERYMEDFSLPGFTVPAFAKAIELLTNARYIVVEQHGGARIHINTTQDLRKISELFTRNDIAFTYGDLADTLYQA